METILRMVSPVVGFLLIGVVLFDVVRTALSARGHGPILRLIHRYGWGALRTFAPAGALGPTILLAGFLAWSLSLWAGWTLVFSGSAESVLHAETSLPAHLLGPIFSTGYITSDSRPRRSASGILCRTAAVAREILPAAPSLHP